MSDNPAADKDWEEAEFRAQVLAKLPDQLSPGTVESAMGHLEISRATLFRLLKQFRAHGRTRALLPSGIFEVVSQLAIAAIESGEERIMSGDVSKGGKLQAGLGEPV